MQAKSIDKELLSKGICHCFQKTCICQMSDAAPGGDAASAGVPAPQSREADRRPTEEHVHVGSAAPARQQTDRAAPEADVQPQTDATTLVEIECLRGELQRLQKEVDTMKAKEAAPSQAAIPLSTPQNAPATTSSQAHGVCVRERGCVRVCACELCMCVYEGVGVCACACM